MNKERINELENIVKQLLEMIVEYEKDIKDWGCCDTELDCDKAKPLINRLQEIINELKNGRA